ncbi:MAG: c-type cytochrome [Chitinophagaceae bacterium]|nr:c-type cytochrome [Chitinophagaceae bacterium]
MRKSIFSHALLAACATIIFSCNSGPKETAEGISREDSLKMQVEHGKYLAVYVAQCIDCHSKRDITKFSTPVIPGTEGGGGLTFGKEEGIPGEVTPPNITPFNLKDWTDDEIARAITQGINKKGDTLFPIMPYNNYSRMSKDDIYAIVAYIRTLKSIDSTVPPRKLMVPMSALPPLPQPDLSKNTKPDPTDKVKYGEYMTTAASCGDCHTPMTPEGTPDFKKAFAGGFVFNTPFFKVTVSNITPDSATGIGSWSEDAFVQKFRARAALVKEGKDPGRQNTFMPWGWYGQMKDEDLKAIYAYLRTVPPVTNKLEKWPK